MFNVTEKNNIDKSLFKNIEGIFFDMDGTLLDSMWLWKAIDIEYLHMHGAEYEDGLQENIAGMSFHQTAEYFKEHFGIKDPIEKMKDDWNQMAMDKYKSEVTLKKGAKEFLDILKNKNIKMAIGTSNSVELTDAALDSTGIRDYFDVVLTGSEILKGKPDPYIYLECAKRTGVDVNNCLVFEDIVSGIKAGKSAGMRVIAVDDDFSKGEVSAKRELSDMYINDFTEICDCF